MKIMPNKKYNTIALYAVLVIAVNVLLIVAILKFSSIAKFFGMLTTVLMPIIWGLVIAFLMNPIMVNFEKLFSNKFKSKKGKKKLLRALSVTLSAIVFLGIVVGLIAIVVPEVVKSVTNLFNNMGDLRENVENWISKTFHNYPSLVRSANEKIDGFTKDASVIFTKIQPVLEDIVSGAWGVLSFLKDFLLGFIVSLYMLCNKETLLAQIKKSIVSITKKSTCAKIMGIASQANKVFSGFIIGKIIDSIIIGLLCFIGMTLMDMQYNIMISVIVGVTNIIPFFGPLIGAIPSTLLMLIVDPKKAILLAIFILILQQFDGNVLGPKILGDSTGLPGFWVLVSLIICGGLFGFAGMVLAVPVFALLYSFTRSYVENKLRKKKLPVTTEYYKQDIEHLYAKPEKKKPMTAQELEKMDIPSAEEVNEVQFEDGDDVKEYKIGE
ncbi:MAG: AI-2E family transporter [Ruminococcus sp.]|nr:AI-2E family transporter [Ruminococcus sp.]